MEIRGVGFGGVDEVVPNVGVVFKIDGEHLEVAFGNGAVECREVGHAPAYLTACGTGGVLQIKQHILALDAMEGERVPVLHHDSEIGQDIALMVLVNDGQFVFVSCSSGCLEFGIVKHETEHLDVAVLHLVGGDVAAQYLLHPVKKRIEGGLVDLGGGKGFYDAGVKVGTVELVDVVAKLLDLVVADGRVQNPGILPREVVKKVLHEKLSQHILRAVCIILLGRLWPFDRDGDDRSQQCAGILGDYLALVGLLAVHDAVGTGGQGIHEHLQHVLWHAPLRLVELLI